MINAKKSLTARSCLFLAKSAQLDFDQAYGFLRKLSRDQGFQGLNGNASFRWSFGPHSAWGSIESTTILTTHPSLLCNNAKFQVGLFHSFHYTGKKKTKSQRHGQCI